MDLDLYVVGLSDGTIRIVVDQGEDEPPFMPHVAKAHGTPLFPIVRAAVEAAPEVERDERGLRWSSRGAAKRALLAAKRAAKEPTR